jgi:hypothetical protein
MAMELSGDELNRYLDIKHRRDSMAYRGYRVIPDTIHATERMSTTKTQTSF